MLDLHSWTKFYNEYCLCMNHHHHYRKYVLVQPYSWKIMFVILTPFITALLTPPPTCPRPTVVRLTVISLTAYSHFPNRIDHSRQLIFWLKYFIWFTLLLLLVGAETPSVIHIINYMTLYSQSWLIDYSDDLHLILYTRNLRFYTWRWRLTYFRSS